MRLGLRHVAAAVHGRRRRAVQLRRLRRLLDRPVPHHHDGAIDADESYVLLVEGWWYSEGAYGASAHGRADDFRPAYLPAIPAPTASPRTPPTKFPFFVVEDGNCVHSPNYPETYGGYQTCAIRTSLEISGLLAVEAFDVHPGSGWDSYYRGGIIRALMTTSRSTASTAAQKRSLLSLRAVCDGSGRRPIWRRRNHVLHFFVVFRDVVRGGRRLQKCLGLHRVPSPAARLIRAAWFARHVGSAGRSCSDTSCAAEPARVC